MGSHSKRVLLVDGDPELERTLSESLQRHGCQCLTARSAREAIDHLERDPGVDAVVTDVGTPDAGGLELTRSIKQRWNEIEVILLTAHGTITSAVEGIQLGAANYMIKPFPPDELVREIERVCSRGTRDDVVDVVDAEDAPRGAPATEAVAEPAERDFAGLVGCHPTVLELKRSIRRIGQLPANVLVLGESGTGKELVARAIHQSSPCRDEPFVAVNCGAFSRSLLEDQLFGHARGAFTGATGSKEGLFVAAGRGTVFLDEIAELDLDLQVKLLRTLQEREVTPLGSDRPVRWRARLVCATNRDLEQRVTAGQFRQDLYYRINVLVLRVPPLRERKEDVPALVECFLGEFAAQSGQRKQVSDEVLGILLNHDWPGNIRQLRNIIERACALGTSGMILPADLPPEMQAVEVRGGFQTLSEVERDHVIRALRTAGGVRVAAARLLGINRNRLARLIRRHRIGEGKPPGAPLPG
jgi:two-component system response regulator AtoC